MVLGSRLQKSPGPDDRRTDVTRLGLDAHGRSARVSRALRWLVVVWAALIVLNGTGIHHRQAGIALADPPLVPIHHAHHADQRIIAPLTAEAQTGSPDQHAPGTGPSALNLLSPTAIALSFVEWD